MKTLWKIISRVCSVGYGRVSSSGEMFQRMEDKSILGGWEKNNEVIWPEGSKLIANPTER